MTMTAEQTRKTATTPAPKKRRSAKPTAPKSKAAKKAPRMPSAEKTPKPTSRNAEAPRATKQPSRRGVRDVASRLQCRFLLKSISWAGYTCRNQ